MAEGDSESVCEDAEGSEVLLEFGDPNRKGLCSGVEGDEVLFKLGGAADEPGDIRGEARSQHSTGAVQLQSGPEGKDRRDEGR